MNKCNLCDFKTKYSGSLTRHKANIHDIGVNWHECNLCDYRGKSNSALKRHKANRHNIDVVWVRCNLCKFKGKNNYSVLSHKKAMHGILCSSCNIRFNDCLHLLLHIATKHNESNFKTNEIELRRT